MTRLLVTYPDAERLMVDHLDHLDARIGVPADWSPQDDEDSVLEVRLDGTPRDLHPIAQQSTVRLIARATSPTAAKALAQEAHAYALVGPWPDGITNVTPLTGITPARDPKTLAELAAVTVRVTVRSTLLDGS